MYRPQQSTLSAKFPSTDLSEQAAFGQLKLLLERQYRLTPNPLLRQAADLMSQARPDESGYKRKRAWKMRRDNDLKNVPARTSQRERIFNLLDSAAAQGFEVSALDLSQVSLQYCARLKELRDLGQENGFQILNRVEHKGGRVLGYYKLVWDRPRRDAFQINTSAVCSVPRSAGVTLPLFPRGGVA